MSTHKLFDTVCVVVLVFAILLTVVFMYGEKLGITVVKDEDAEYNSDSVYFTARDLDGDWTGYKVTKITLKGDTASVSGNGAYAYDGGVRITAAGWYDVYGELDDGSITVDAKSSSKVWIRLNGVTVNCSDDACFIVDQADKVFLTLAEGTENYFVSGENYSDAALEDGTGGAVFAQDDLTINGSGKLTVTALFKHGIEANDDLVIAGGDITINAAKDGISVNDSLRIANATLTVDAADDGLQVKTDEGYIYILSGDINITSKDDAIHTVGLVTIDGGSITINAADDGIHSDTDVVINGGTVLINDCCEGIEAVTITINGGDTTIYASDDGINANGASGNSFSGGGSGPTASSDAENVSDTESDDDGVGTCVKITGGTLTILNPTANDSDGIDSNGDIIITGGTIRVSILANGPSNAIDFGGEAGGVAEISGGTIIACGSSTMAESFDDSSTQPCILYNTSNNLAGGSRVCLMDDTGNVLLEWEVPSSFNSMVISCPELEVGKTYYLTIGDNYDEITIGSVSAAYGDAEAGGFGGPSFGGGMNRFDQNSNQESGSGGAPGGNDQQQGENTSGEAPEQNGDQQPGDASSSAGGNDTGENQQSTENGDQQQGGGQGGFAPDTRTTDMTEVTDDANDETVVETKTDVTTEQWIYIGVSVLVLFGGIIFAVVYKRRKF